MRRLDRQEHHSDAILARRRQREAQFCALARKEGVRDLDQDACAIAGLRIATASAAMREIDEDLQAFGDNVVRLLALNIDYEANAAGVVLVARVVESLSGGKSSHSSV